MFAGRLDSWGSSGVVAAPAPAWAAAPGRATAVTWLETAAVMGLLLMLSQALLGRLGNPDGIGEPPAWLRQMWLPAYGVILAVAAHRAGLLARSWAGALMVAPVVIWALASRFWSLDPEVSARRSYALLMPTLFALFLAARYDWKGLIRLIAITSVILAVGSLAVAVALPGFGVHTDTHVGAWRGLFFEKNLLGGFMVRGALACLCVMTFDRPRRWFWLVAAALCALLVIKSTSTTAILGLLVMLAGFIAIAFLRRGPAFAVTGVWLAVAGGLAILAVFALAPEIFFDLVGKDATLTGRTQIWAAIMRQVEHRPLQGYGYGAFWISKPGPATWVALQANWAVLAADNAWAEILVQLGWMGVALFALSLVGMAVAAVVALFSRGPQGYWAPLLVVTLLLTSITESIFLKQNDLTWVLYVATLAKLLQTREPEPSV